MGEDRAPGLHLSHITRLMRAAANAGKPEPVFAQEGVHMQMGFLFEHAIKLMIGGQIPYEAAMELAFKRYCIQIRPAVVTQITGSLDEIEMTPDGFDAAEGLIESYKWTTRSMKKAATKLAFEEHFWTWLVAEKGYCLAWGVDTTRFYICWDRGDYSFGATGGPQVHVYDCIYTYEELKENWAGVMAYKPLALASLQGGEAK